jgi:hypothetical protein
LDLGSEKTREILQAMLSAKKVLFNLAKVPETYEFHRTGSPAVQALMNPEST